MADDELKSKSRKRSKETVNAFFAWRKVYLGRLFDRKEVKKNMRLFGLAFYLSEHFDWEDYSCWPSRETIAEAIGVEVRTVSTLTNKLAEMGFLRVKRRGPDMSALYIGRLPDDAQSNAHQEAQSNARHGTASDGLKRNPTSLDAQLNCNQTCNGLHPNDSDERSFERKGAAQAAPPYRKNVEHSLKGAGLKGRPLTGENVQFCEQNPNPAGGKNNPPDDFREIRTMVQRCSAEADSLSHTDRPFLARLSAQLAAGEVPARPDIERLRTLFEFIELTDGADADDADSVSIPF